MAAPTVVEIPHRLGRSGARARIAARLGELPAHLPGGVGTVRSDWQAEDRLVLEVTALGQTLDATLDIEERVIRVTMLLPPLLAMMSGAIAGAVREKGGQLLLGDDAGR